MHGLAIRIAIFTKYQLAYRQSIINQMPPEESMTFPNFLVTDCTKIRTHALIVLAMQSYFYSDYKCSTT